jgi:hypothetical protein
LALCEVPSVARAVPADSSWQVKRWIDTFAHASWDVCDFGGWTPALAPVAMTGGNVLIVVGPSGQRRLEPLAFDDWAMSHEGGLSRENPAVWGSILPTSAGKGRFGPILTAFLLHGGGHVKPIGSVAWLLGEVARTNPRCTPTHSLQEPRQTGGTAPQHGCASIGHRQLSPCQRKWLPSVTLKFVFSVQASPELNV